MNILRRITLKTLKKNKSRTIVTIIGVILSAAMITAVATFASSMQTSLLKDSIATYGDWHLKVDGLNSLEAQQLGADDQLSSTILTRQIGYAMLPDEADSHYTPYYFLTGFSQEALDTYPINLVAGELPKNDREIVIDDSLNNYASLSYKIGDTVTLDLGVRMYEGEELWMNNSFYWNSDETPAEELIVKEQKTYTIVGIVGTNMMLEHSNPGYLLITKENLDTEGLSNLTAYLKMNNAADVYDYAESLSQSAGINSSVLRYQGVSNRDSFMRVIYSLCTILVIIIMCGSILLIYNAFSISVSERTKQFGLLSSVGATSKQLSKSVLSEALFVSAIGIPLGILSGIAGIGVTIWLMGTKLSSAVLATDMPMTLHVSIPAILIAAAVALVTILISAYIPAKRVSKLSAMDAIRQTKDVNIRAKDLGRSSKHTGLSRMLAKKNFKRNKKRYRSTIISLFVSIVLFISASAFTMYLSGSVSDVLEQSNYDLAYQLNREASEQTRDTLFQSLTNLDGITDSAWYQDTVFLGTMPEDAMTKKAADYFKEYGENTFFYIQIALLPDALYKQTFGEDAYAAFDPNNPKAIALNKAVVHDDIRDQFEELTLFEQKLPITVSVDEEDQPGIAQYEIGSLTERFPLGFTDTGSKLTLFYPVSAVSSLPLAEEQLYGTEMVFTSSDANASYEAAKEHLIEQGLQTDSLINVKENEEEYRNLILTVNVFSYGFIVLISLIAVANVFNTVSTNVSLRKREFAMLKSIGMTDKAFRRMINYECLIYGCKALLYELPIAFLITYAIYRSIGYGYSVQFTLPWTAIIISIVSVFVVVFISMMYSVHKTKKESIIDALKNENI